MTDPELTALLQWALPRMGLRWAGYRRVRGQVEKRVRRRIAALALDGVAGYRARLAEDPDEVFVGDLQQPVLGQPPPPVDGQAT